MWCVVRVSLSLSLSLSFSLSVFLLFSFLSFTHFFPSRPPFLSCPFVVKRGVSGEDYQTLIKLSTAATGLTYVRPFLSRGWRITRFQVESASLATNARRSHRNFVNEKSDICTSRKRAVESEPDHTPIHGPALQYASTAICTYKTYFSSIS